MKLNEASAWFDEIAQRQVRRRSIPGKTTLGGNPYTEYDNREAIQWITDADSAIKSVFPPGHALVKRWDAALQSAPQVTAWHYDAVVEGTRAIFEAARAQLNSGRIIGLVDTIRAESVGELLDQAETLGAGNYLTAATVTAGGALESFLKHLCERNGVTWEGHGSIAAYDRALAQARNRGNEIISPTYSKLVAGWGGMRNVAAHTPGQFTHGEAEVRAMIVGIREFVARHT